MLNSVNQQSILPQEIIIAISETSPESANQLQVSLQSGSSVPVVVVPTEDKAYAGPNRNRGAIAAKVLIHIIIFNAHTRMGDLQLCNLICFCLAQSRFITFFDADDEMHRDRIKLVRDTFKVYRPHCVLHTAVVGDLQPFRETNLSIATAEVYLGQAIYKFTVEHDEKTYDSKGIRITPEYPLFYPMESASLSLVQYGHISCDAQVLKDEQYSNDDRGQDVRFARQVVSRYGSDDHTMVLMNLPLSFYHPSNHPNNKDLISGETLKTSPSNVKIPQFDFQPIIG
jgi:hypothetical protein